MEKPSSESRFKAGDVIWIKFGQLHWPAEILAFDSLPKNIKDDFEGRPVPKVVAKFFDEDGYEFYNEDKNLLDYNCPKKEDYIKKGIVRCRQKTKEGSKDALFTKFPNDIIKSEKLTGGDVNILEKDPFVERKEPKVSYKDIFGTPDEGKKGKKKGKDSDPAHGKEKGKNLKRKSSASPVATTPKSRKKGDATKTPPRPIIHPRFREGGGGSDHQVKILPQPSAPIDLDLQVKQEKASTPNAYTCQLCDFSATRLNVIVLHQKSHSEPAKLPVANNRGASGRAKGSSSTSNQSTPKKKQEINNSSKTKSTGPIRNKSKEPSDSSKASPNAMSNKNNKSTPKKKVVDQDPAPKQKSGSVNKKNTKEESSSDKESVPKRRNIPSTPNASQNSTTTKNKNHTPALPSPKQSPSISPVKSSTKRKRMTKQEKLDREKKAEERSKLLDDWSEEEEEAEAEEKKQIKEIIKQKGGDSSDSGSDDEREPAFLDDDNIHGYDDDDEEILPPEPLNSKSSASHESNDKCSETSELKDKLNVNKVLNQKSGNDLEDKLLDIDKMLEETEVPKLKIDPSSSNISKKPKRGVKFSTELSKDIAIKKIQLVQTPSNLADPMDVDDEFAFSEEPELAVAKPILKRPNRPPPKIIQEPVKLDEESNLITESTESTRQDCGKLLENSPTDEKKKLEPKEPMHENISTTLQSKAGGKSESTISDKSPENLDTQVNNMEIEGKSSSSSIESSSTENKTNLIKDPKCSTAISEVDLSETAQQLGNNHESKKEEHELQTQAGQDTLSTAAENAEAVPSTGQGNDQEETYILLVDDNSDNVVDSLNSQLLYLDSNSLANGNVVLMTQDSVNAATQQGNGTEHTIAGTTENNAVANGGTVLSIPPGGLQSLERQVVTTVDTKGGVATIPGQVQHASAASQIQLITSPAQAPGPLVSATAKPTSIQSTE